ncbi:MAG: dethiobiotin synthase [Vampirovibrionales bacterium]|nr:dethiobiotin synthase [Vampirovibrionales bacterium]
MASALFITGTGTDVGKTLVTALLAAFAQSQGRSVCVYKPFQTGAASDADTDPATINRWLAQPVETRIGYRFAPPVAPFVADDRHEIRLETVLERVAALRARFDLTLVEGAGGVRVPLAPSLELIDVMAALDLPTLVVARPDLGTINHTLLTLEALQTRKIPVRGVVVSRFEADSPDQAIAALPRVWDAFLPVPVLAWIPSLDLTPGALTGEHPAVRAMAACF